ncbi:MAG: hypothetical protein PHW11_03090 [Anaerolineaceae bacterium]|jgi:hypothetical protein|nr:hypothetical protein [Anaerolineaceae bacterium]MDD4042392.1 hypothetical protein [Anaerolineaceae bacterium]MDD4579025.1 hypothetical protein [Anaerolineaceae bacterium]
MKNAARLREWIARALIGLVFGVNLACALDFIARPQLYMAGYELSGEVGRVVIIGYGILFLMWQVPYTFALYHPGKFRVSLIQAIIMQTIGLVGETLLLGTIPMEHAVLHGSISRFIYFDGGGLVLLIVAFFLVYRRNISQNEENHELV